MPVNQTELITIYGFFILTIVLLVIELLIPKKIALLWACASAIAGFMHWLFPQIALGTQVIILIVIGLLFTGVYLKRKKNPITEHDYRGKSLIGQSFELITDIKRGKGKIKIDNATWYVQCDTPLKKGNRVKVQHSKGTILEVAQDA